MDNTKAVLILILILLSLVIGVLIMVVRRFANDNVELNNKLARKSESHESLERVIEKCKIDYNSLQRLLSRSNDEYHKQLEQVIDNHELTKKQLDRVKKERNDIATKLTKEMESVNGLNDTIKALGDSHDRLLGIFQRERADLNAAKTIMEGFVGSVAKGAIKVYPEEDGVLDYVQTMETFLKRED